MVRLFQLFAVVVVSAFFVAQPAGAFCVLNETPESLDIFAGQCRDCLRTTLAPSEAACCPAGEPHCQDRVVTFKESRAIDALAWSDCGAPVPASGWVRIHPGETPETEHKTICRVMDAGGNLLSDEVVSPSHTCPSPSLTPSTC